MDPSERLYLEGARLGAAYLRKAGERGVAPDPAAIAGLERLGEPLPDEPTDPAAVLELLDAAGSPATIINAGGRYFGFVNGGALPAARGAQVLAAAWDQNAALRVMSPVAAELEAIALGWMLDLLGLPGECGAGFVTGATMANFACLAAARHEVLRQVGWDVEAQGLFGAPPITVAVSEEVHSSLLKALAMLGLGRERVIRVPTDRQGRMLAGHLPKLEGPAIVCIQAGNVNTGAFDPAGPICRDAHAAGAWVHLDGAFGLWAAAAPAHAYLTEGIAGADSWATDAHKWLNVPYDCGLAFVRHGVALRTALSQQAAYLPAGETREPMHWTPESSRRARGVEVWAALRSLGRKGLASLIETNCGHARRFADGLRSAGFEILNDVVLNQVLVSFGPPERTRQVIRAIQEDGVCWCGGTVWKGRTAMRISVSSWATTEADVERSLTAMLACAAGDSR